ncbi:MAG TPA: metalloregulator ArsR/SmtB family transcription factor [Noviherbaspirillum sp.]
MQTSFSSGQDVVHIEEASYYFGLLAEPTRLKILSSLCQGERPVNRIVDDIQTSQANVSRQLNMLYQAKILARRKDRNQVYYRISDQKTVDLCRTMCRRMAIALRSTADGCVHHTCRMADNRCAIAGAECRWQPLSFTVVASN